MSEPTFAKMLAMQVSPDADLESIIEIIEYEIERRDEQLAEFLADDLHIAKYAGIEVNELRAFMLAGYKSRFADFRKKDNER